MNIYDPVFSSAQVAAAAGMTPANFRAHLARGNWRIMGGDKGGRAATTAGLGHFFTIYDVMGYALAAKLMEAGVDPKTAYERAMFDFAHVGDTSYLGTEQIMREPGDVFPMAHGFTIFSYVPGAERGECYASKLIGDPTMLFHQRGGGFAETAIIIQLNLLRQRVFEILKLDVRDHE